MPDGQQGGRPAWQSCYRGDAPLRRRNRQQRRDGAAANIVDAREYDVERRWREARISQIAPISTNLVLAYIAEHVLGMPRSY